MLTDMARCLTATSKVQSSGLLLLKFQTMTEWENTITLKTAELEAELKITGLWQTQLPLWVIRYEEKHGINSTDFAQWLQFIFIPNHLKKINSLPATEKKLLVPQAFKYFGSDVGKGKLLQILVEIDSLV
jgi:uncharacterized protein YqcC (DUF446 family)